MLLEFSDTDSLLGLKKPRKLSLLRFPLSPKEVFLLNSLPETIFEPPVASQDGVCL